MRGDTLMGKMVATKQTSWKYEEETRLVTDKFGRHDYLPSALHGIIFGTKMSEDDKKHIKESLTGRNIKFYQLYKKEDTYGYLFNHVLNIRSLHLFLIICTYINSFQIR